MVRGVCARYNWAQQNNTHVPRLKPCLRHPCTPCTRKRWHGPSPTKPPTRRCTSSPSSTPTASGASRPSGSTGSSRSKVKQTSFDDHHVDIKWFADGTLNVSHNCLDRHLAERGRPGGDHLEGDDPPTTRKSPTASSTSRSAGSPTPCAVGRAPRRRSDHLHADDPRGRGRHARLHPHRRDPLGGLRRLLPEALAGRIIDCKSKVVITADEGVRGGKRTPLKANVDDALTNPETSSVQKIIVCKRTGAEIKWNQHRDVWYDDDEGCRQHLRTQNGRRGPAVHPLHLRLHRQAEGRAAYHRRLPGVRLADPRAGLRLPSGRSLLVHRRHRLGHRPHLHRLWPAGQRRHHHSVRGRAELPRRDPRGEIIDKHKVNILYTRRPRSAR